MANRVVVSHFDGIGQDDEGVFVGFFQLAHILSILDGHASRACEGHQQFQIAVYEGTRCAAGVDIDDAEAFILAGQGGAHGRGDVLTDDAGPGLKARIVRGIECDYGFAVFVSSIHDRGADFNFGVPRARAHKLGNKFLFHGVVEQDDTVVAGNELKRFLRGPVRKVC